MFTLFKSPPKFPNVQSVNLKSVQLYASKFEEAIRNFEELQKETLDS